MWIFCGSHGGLNAAKHALSYSVSGIVFNDAGIGKDSAGVAGLEYFDQYGVPAASVDCHTARIGDGVDTLENGLISKVNQSASLLGIIVGMPCAQVINVLKTIQDSKVS